MPDNGFNMGAGPEPATEGEPEGLDIERAREMATFVLHAARRRPRLVLLTFLIVAGLGLTVAFTMPLTYSSQVKLLAQRSSAMHIIGGALPQMDAVDNPIKNVSAMIMRRDKLVALVKDANLVQRFIETRPPALRLKDRAMAALLGQPSEQDMVLSMVRTLERRLDVTTDDPTSTVVITVEWSNAQLAYDLVTLVQKNFLEARYDSDVEMVTDSIAVLEDHAKSELANVDAELANYQKVVSDWEAKRVRSGPALAPARVFLAGPRVDPGPASAARQDPDVIKALEDKRLQIRAADESRQRAMETVRQQLAEAEATLTPMHPTVIALQQQIESMAAPSAEYLELKNEERALMVQLAEPSGFAAPLPAQHSWALAAVDGGAQPAVSGPVLAADLDRDGQLQLAQSRLQSASRGYEDALGRLDAAKVELDITHAAYKHQYTVVTPAELPKGPKKPTAVLTGIASVIGGAMLALLLAALSDILGGQVLEAWQIRRNLRIDVLAELDRPA